MDVRLFRSLRVISLILSYILHHHPVDDKLSNQKIPAATEARRNRLGHYACVHACRLWNALFVLTRVKVRDRERDREIGADR